jgi:hypothetical protein
MKKPRRLHWWDFVDGVARIAEFDRRGVTLSEKDGAKWYETPMTAAHSRTIKLLLQGRAQGTRLLSD